MVQRTSLMIAAGLTAFVLVLIGGAVAVVSERSNSAPAAAAPAAGAPATAPASLSADQAATIAQGIIPGATLVRPPELVNVQGVITDAVQLDRGTVYVEANSGQVLASDIAAPPRFDRSGDDEPEFVRDDDRRGRARTVEWRDDFRHDGRFERHEEDDDD